MILDIDIRVSNDNGVEIHQFAKRFDSRFEGKRINGTSASKDFEEFLAEFLSSSGRVIRNQLITDPATSFDVPNDINRSSNNLEYTLKLGDSQSISGNIPLDKLFRLSELSKFSNPSYTETIHDTSNSINHENNLVDKSEDLKYDSDDDLILKHNAFKPAFDLSEVDKMFQQLIETAVARYEDSFSVIDSESSSFLESS